MRCLLPIIFLLAYFSTFCLADNVVGKCPLATKLFSSKSSKDETEQISQSTMCPKIKDSCCDADTYKAMNVWWDNSGSMSMNRLWLEKIQRIYKEMRLMQLVFFPKVMNWIATYLKSDEPNPQCLSRAKMIKILWDVNAYDQLFQMFPSTIEKCWQYTIDFLRGLACSVCDSSSEFYYTTKYFGISQKECNGFCNACSQHLKVFKTFFEYTKNMSSMASCKSKNEVASDEDINYFTQDYYHQINEALAYPEGNGCNALCRVSMPWTGITQHELTMWSQLQKFLDNIKASFKDPRWTKEADSIVTTWETNKDKILTANFKQTQIRPGGFNITDNFNATNSGLSLDRLGFATVKEFVGIQNEIAYLSGFIVRLSLWGMVVCAFLMTLDGGW